MATKVGRPESLVVLRGLRYTGKTSVLRRMKGQDFLDQYSATPWLAASEIGWRAPSGEPYLVKLWDVPEKAFPSEEAPEAEQPDASNVDTLTRAHGIVVLIDTRILPSVELAVRIVREAPRAAQLCVFSNFADENPRPSIPDALRRLLSQRQFYYIVGSAKTNQGMKELSMWLALPLLEAKRRSCDDALRVAARDLAEFAASFVGPADQGLGDAPPARPLSAAVSDPGLGLAAGGDDGDFWSDDDGAAGVRSSLTAPSASAVKQRELGGGSAGIGRETGIGGGGSAAAAEDVPVRASPAPASTPAAAPTPTPAPEAARGRAAVRAIGRQQAATGERPVIQPRRQVRLATG